MSLHDKTKFHGKETDKYKSLKNLEKKIYEKNGLDYVDPNSDKVLDDIVYKDNIDKALEDQMLRGKHIFDESFLLHSVKNIRSLCKNNYLDLYVQEYRDLDSRGIKIIRLTKDELLDIYTKKDVLSRLSDSFGKENIKLLVTTPTKIMRDLEKVFGKDTDFLEGFLDYTENSIKNMYDKSIFNFTTVEEGYKHKIKNFDDFVKEGSDFQD